MVKLRYSSGNVISPKIHKIGILALGSHLENHGAALPIDTDSKIAAYLALQASFRTGAKFLGILYAASEYNYINHGIHIDPKELVEKHLKSALKLAKDYLNIEKVVLVNGHGGNKPITQYIVDVENELGVEIIFNNKIVEIEGPHAGGGELSIASFLGIVDYSKIKEHCNFKMYPEVGMVGFKRARDVDDEIDKSAKIVESEGVFVDTKLGHLLLEAAIDDIIEDIRSMI